MLCTYLFSFVPKLTLSFYPANKLGRKMLKLIQKMLLIGDILYFSSKTVKATFSSPTESSECNLHCLCNQPVQPKNKMVAASDSDVIFDGVKCGAIVCTPQGLACTRQGHLQCIKHRCVDDKNVFTISKTRANVSEAQTQNPDLLMEKF